LHLLYIAAVGAVCVFAQMRNFAVVEFCDENTVGVVPKSWLDESESQVNTKYNVFTCHGIFCIGILFSCVSEAVSGTTG